MAVARICLSFCLCVRGFCTNLSLVLLVTLFLFRFCSGFEQDFTITVPPGKEECFYQSVTMGQVIDVEFQVIDGGHGNFDVHFGLYNPQGKSVVIDFKKTDGAHRHEAKETGDYKVCFDNTFSRISAKVVFFELVIDSGDDDDDDEDGDDVQSVVDVIKKTTDATNRDERVTPEEIYEMTVEDIEEKMNMVRNNLQRVKHLQEQLRAFEARDRNIQERNFSTVNSWSILQLVVMLVVSLVQVVMLRSLFDEKSRVHSFWKKMTAMTNKY